MHSTAVSRCFRNFSLLPLRMTFKWKFKMAIDMPDSSSYIIYYLLHKRGTPVHVATFSPFPSLIRDSTSQDSLPQPFLPFSLSFSFTLFHRHALITTITLSRNVGEKWKPRHSTLLDAPWARFSSGIQFFCYNSLCRVTSYPSFGKKTALRVSSLVSLIFALREYSLLERGWNVMCPVHFNLLIKRVTWWTERNSWA